jgi:glycerophosphoryl diester phosphodiesterase
VKGWSEVQKFAYLSPALPRIFAHRGFANNHAENTLEAFKSAIFAGATHIESDVQVTKDGFAVLFHDDNLSRVAGLPLKISELTLVRLQGLALTDGGYIPTLEQALKAFPSARFNLDFKVWGALEPAAEVINRLRANNRVLVASFSDRRRVAALKLLQGRVASSAGSSRVFGLYIAYLFGFKALINRLARSVQLLQLPISAGLMRFDNRKFIAAMSKAGLEVHFWTINEPAEMTRLIGLGAHGIVTDRVDLAVNTLRMQ